MGSNNVNIPCTIVWQRLPCEPEPLAVRIPFQETMKMFFHSPIYGVVGLARDPRHLHRDTVVPQRTSTIHESCIQKEIRVVSLAPRSLVLPTPQPRCKTGTKVVPDKDKGCQISRERDSCLDAPACECRLTYSALHMKLENSIAEALFVPNK